ncbi:MAG: hypothetical protein N2558_00575 [Patescibacteria group bacterium]|nr:hypothetical protein [Patescibacteria group bacterium]
MKINCSFEKIDKLVLIVVIFIASLLRIYNLSTNPPSLTPDEAALGYNAYSILKTGKDEHGKFLPLIIESFGDYKPALYVYFVIPFVFFLGLTELSVRLPSAIAGIFAIFLIYKILKEFFDNLKNQEKNQKLSKIYYFAPLVASFLLAVSPWHIAFSRGGWEANVSLTITLFGILMFIRGVKNYKCLIFSFFAFALTLLTYQGAKLSSLIVFFVLVLVFYQELLKDFRGKIFYLLVSFIVSFIVIFPVLLSFRAGEAGRLEVFSVFSYPRSEEYINQFLQRANEQKGDLQYYLFHNEALNFARGILGRWFNHFSGRFLFFEGDWQNPRHLPPNHGVLLFADVLFLVLGFYSLFKINSLKLSVFVVSWLIISPLPAVLSRDQVHAVRSLNMLIPLTIICAFGFIYFVDFLDKSKNWLIRSSLFGFLFTSYLVSFIYFIDAYFIHQPIHNAKHWQFGYKQVVQSLKLYIESENKIIFQQSYAQPYIYYLFYSQYDPRKLQARKLERYKENRHDVSLVKSIDSIYFENFSWPKHAEEGSIIVGNEISIPSDFDKWSGYELVSRIKNLDGSIAFTVVKVK